ncbi:hypothetical protein Aam_173_014 [Acidocella aminolytica 101 = DSM 11237]|uniref:Uncharacterized protein n=1 Tax=Acidocella aminolytica 101 = DSM 11237 TaxID=1120923 RepID=A0A0D6PK65_9PROT|nr:hypothetical protein Aam_173_014 [Acidocella aminolytica 101 = DSM 11237]
MLRTAAAKPMGTDCIIQTDGGMKRYWFPGAIQIQEKNAPLFIPAMCGTPTMAYFRHHIEAIETICF